MKPATGATPLIALDAVALDTETTGLDTAKARIVQIGAIAVSRGRIHDGRQIEMLVDPEIAIPSASTRIHGVTNAMVRNAPAFAAANPELCHNEVCGWGQHGDMTRQVFTLVELRHDEEHPQESRRFDLVRDIMAEVVHDVIEVRAEGDGPLAQLFDLTLVGDFVSLHMAAQEGLDPGPVPVLEDLKRALAE
jgi:hypothetical protein